MTGSTEAPALPLKDRTVLIVEDEVIISFLIQDLLEELGCTAILQAASVQAAAAILASRKPDLAVLDVNVGGDLVYPIAEQLGAAGIPFLFTTGYGRVGIPDKWHDRPVLQKPYDARALLSALTGLLAA